MGLVRTDFSKNFVYKEMFDEVQKKIAAIKMTLLLRSYQNLGDTS